MQHHSLLTDLTVFPQVLHVCRRMLSKECDGRKKKGLVLAAYSGCSPGEYSLTSAGSTFDQSVGGKVSKFIKKAKLPLGTCRVLNDVGKEYYAVAVTGAGQEGLGYNEDELLNECKENIRIAAGVGAQALQEMGVTDIDVEGFSCPEAAAEGSALGVWTFQRFKYPSARTTESKVKLYCHPDKMGWQKGLVKADAQNIARELTEYPANRLTPSFLAERAIKILCPCGVKMEVRDRDWLEKKKMNSFIKAGSSCGPPLLIEASYCGGGEDDKPVIIVGVGHTFDSGGLCLKPAKDMKLHRADMAGAASAIGILKALAALKVPINVTALIPVCENMPGGNAMRPGDVVFALNGKSFVVKDTAKESRVIIADALVYSSVFNPCLVVSLGTMTRGVVPSLGEAPSATFCTSNVVWGELKRAGAETGDRVWRFPLWRYYSNRLKHGGADLTSTGNGRGGDSCVAAAFLLNFVPPVDFAGLDISGTGKVSSGYDFPYLRRGLMTGRPTRTIIQFLHQMACPNDAVNPC